MRRLWVRLVASIRRQALDRELDDEIAAHLEFSTTEMQSRGLQPDAARRAALKSFGGRTQIKDADRDLRTFPRVEMWWRACRDACRRLWKQPRLVAIATLTLGLGMGATTAVYSVVNGVLLKPLPFNEPDRLVALYHVTPINSKDQQGEATYFTYRDHGTVFEDVGLWQSANVAVIRSGVPEQTRVLRVTDGTLPLLGVHPEIGRLIAKEHDAPGQPLVTVLTHAYWQQAFAGARDVIGQSLVVNGEPCEIIGVLPASFRFLTTDPQLVLPMRLNRVTARTGPLGRDGIGRLKPGVTIAQANADIARMIPLLTEQYPLMNGVSPEMWRSVKLAPNVRPLAETLIGDLRRPLWILLGTVAIVLLMAWTNVANLMLVRAEGRQQEFAVRGAIGASRGRLAADLLSESLLLGLTGGSLGLVVAQSGIVFLRWLAPSALPRHDEIRLDTHVLLVTFALSVVTSLLFGLMPVWRTRRVSVEALKDAGRGATGAPGRHRLRNTLVIAQIALAVLLLAVSGLMVRTFLNMRHVSAGFANASAVQTFEISLPPSLVKEPKDVVATWEQIRAHLERIPGVASVGIGMIAMDGRGGKGPVFVEGEAGQALPPIHFNWPVGPGYFETMGNPVVAGRPITWNDIHQGRSLAMISENLALEHWDTAAHAIGHRVRTFASGPWLEVVGVVGNVRAEGLNHPPPALLYLPITESQNVPRYMMVVARSERAGTASLLHELQHAVWAVNPRVPLANPKTVADIQAQSMAPTSFATVMLMLAAGVALLLALVGVYSVVSYVAAERTSEIGIRMALGAQTADVRRLLLGHSLALTLTGIVIGLAAAVLMTPPLASLLYGVKPLDPTTYATVALLLAGVTLVAMYLPVSRACRVEPSIAMRRNG